jgi:hypothetical protein
MVSMSRKRIQEKEKGELIEKGMIFYGCPE